LRAGPGAGVPPRPGADWLAWRRMGSWSVLLSVWQPITLQCPSRAIGKRPGSLLATGSRLRPNGDLVWRDDSAGGTPTWVTDGRPQKDADDRGE
jgi:hypothetical protein